jgi:3-oxoacyl-[acyl-carrier-protein] synthase III
MREGVEDADAGMTLGIPISAVASAQSFEASDVQVLAAEARLPDVEREKLRDGGLVLVPVAKADLVELVTEVLTELSHADWRPETCASVVFAHSLELTEDQVVAVETMLRTALPGLVRRPLIVTGRPCSIIHLGIELAANLHELHPTATTLVLGADIAKATEDRFFFGSAMGDAAVGLVLGDRPAFGHLLAVCSTHHIIADNGTASSPEQMTRFRAQNPSAIRATIDSALNLAGLTWADLTAIVPHTPYRSIWDTISVLCRFPRERILDDGVARTGHLNSNDVLVHFASAARDGRLAPGDVVALVSPGFGGTRGCTIIRCGSSHPKDGGCHEPRF